MKNVCAVVVTYNPNLETLSKLLGGLKQEGALLVIVDNGSEQDIKSWNDAQGVLADEVICLESNLGLAKAQNVGIEHAKQHHMKYVLLMDQDSLPEDSMLSLLYEKGEEIGNFGAIGPYFRDPEKNLPTPLVAVRGLRLTRRKLADDETEPVEVDFLIASGSLISLRTIEIVGLMREEFFIDYVDIEWCLRAKSKGFRNYCLPTARMNHSLGDRSVLFFGRALPLYKPLRNYYHFRNALLVYRLSWIPLNWKIVDFSRLLFRFCVYLVTGRPRSVGIRMSFLGVYHGLLNRAGKYSF